MKKFSRIVAKSTNGSLPKILGESAELGHIQSISKPKSALSTCCAKQFDRRLYVTNAILKQQWDP